MPEKSFSGQSIILTGASSGIGRALALQLASQGARLALAARRVDRLEALACECSALGGEALALPTDVADEAQCRRLVEQTAAAFGGLDMLVNNAGIGVGSALADLPDLRLFKQVIDVNFYGMVYCTYHALPLLKRSRGRLVNISSLGGKMALPGNTSYCASKYAMHGFSDSLRMELAPAGVSVTVVCPYWVVTEFHEHFMNKEGQQMGPSGRAIYTSRMMTAERCAEIVLRAAFKRKREVLLSPGPFVIWLKLVAPGLLDRLTLAILRPAAKRITAHRENQAHGD